MPAIWDAADDIRKILNWIAPIAAIGLSILWGFLWADAFVTPRGFFNFSFGRPALSGYAISAIIIGIASGILYFIPNIGPFMSIKDGEVLTQTQHIVMIICAGMAWYGSMYWGGVIMAFQALFVCILGSDPIWEAFGS